MSIEEFREWLEDNHYELIKEQSEENHHEVYQTINEDMEPIDIAILHVPMVPMGSEIVEVIQFPNFIITLPDNLKLVGKKIKLSLPV